MKQKFFLHETLKADGFAPDFSGDFWRVYLDDMKLGGRRELAVYSSEQDAPQISKMDDSIIWYYPNLRAEDGRVYEISLTLTAVLSDGVWEYSATMDNKSSVRLNELQYPFFTTEHVNGDFSEDILYVPNGLGQKIIDPHKATKANHTEYMAADYKNVVQFYPYPAFPLSMPWLVLESGGKSLYLGYHSEVWKKVAFVTETEPRGAAKEQFILGICSYPAVYPGECITYGGMTAALFDGDWRECADFYRAWAEKTWLKPLVLKDSVRNLQGWQRIILKHQFGDVYNTYADLPRIYREGAKYGINMLLLFAWWEEGMDNGYPNYRPSEELGGAEALRKAIDEINEMGGRVFLYSNGHIIDKATDYYKTEGWRYTMKDIEGNDYIEKYQFSNSGTMLKMGHKTFVSGCYGTPQWANKVEELELRQLELGGNGAFFDQLGCGYYLCFDTTHAHKNRIDLDPEYRLQTVHKLCDNLHGDEWFGTECVSDRITLKMDFTHGCGPSCQYDEEAFPYLFRYTFPECIISNRLIHDEKEGWEKHLNYAFVHGLIFDVSVYRCRAKSMDVLPNFGKKMAELIELRKQYLDFFTLGKFDMLDLPKKVWGAKYTYNGQSIAAIWNDSGADIVYNGTAVSHGGVAVIEL